MEQYGANRNNLLLSICIPTYNQPSQLEKTLNSIVFQLKNYEKEVQIIICDDSWDNDSENIVDSFLSNKEIKISYFRGNKNGFDGAIISLTEKALGKYIWWFGDDIMAIGAIERVLNLINNTPEISFIWINSRDVNNENDIALKLGGDKFFNDGNEVLESDVGLLAFVSTTVVKKEKVLSGIKSAKKRIGCNLMSMYLVFCVLSQDGKFFFLSTPYIISKPKLSGEKRWYDSFEVFGINLFNIVQEFNNKFDKRSIKKALALNFGNIWRAVLVERAMGFTTGFGSRTPKIKKMFKCYWNFLEFWLALPFFLMPRFVLKFFYRIFKIIKGKNYNK